MRMNKESISTVLAAVTVISLIVGTSVYLNQPELNNNAVSSTSRNQEKQIDKVLSPSSPSQSSSSILSTSASSPSPVMSSDLQRDPVPVSKESTKTQSPNIIKLNRTEFDQIDNSQFRKAPEFAAIANYVNTNNSEQLSLEDLRGKVVVVNIWTYSCINCIRTLPYLNDWHEKYEDKGLVIVGIHTPEFGFEKDINNVRSAVDDFGIKYPVLQDNDKGTWDAYENRYWPRKYVIDTEGYIRYDHVGEGAYAETEKVIQYLLAERAAKLGETEITF